MERYVVINTYISIYIYESYNMTISIDYRPIDHIYRYSQYCVYI